MSHPVKQRIDKIHSQATQLISNDFLYKAGSTLPHTHTHTLTHTPTLIQVSSHLKFDVQSSQVSFIMKKEKKKDYMSHVRKLKTFVVLHDLNCFDDSRKI